MPRRPRSSVFACVVVVAGATVTCCAVLAAAAGAGDAAAGAWAVTFPAAASWSLPRAPGTLPRCAFPGAPSAGPVSPQLRTLCVIGERHSGTNFVSALLDLNFAFEDDASAADDKASDVNATASTPRLALQAHPRLADALGRVPPRPGRVGHGCARRAPARSHTSKRALTCDLARSCTAHKHAAQPVRGAAAHVAPGFAPVDEADFLAVLVVRNPLDWCAPLCRTCIAHPDVRADSQRLHTTGRRACTPRRGRRRCLT
jgi:hypothetical protein